MEKTEEMRSLREVAQALTAADDTAVVEEFLKSLFTESEIYEIATRWALVRMIDAGISQRNISNKLGLSLCKITRGSKELKKEHSAFVRMLEIFNTNYPQVD
jgi:TrpR family trp operon transcriptional repressor